MYCPAVVSHIYTVWPVMCRNVHQALHTFFNPVPGRGGAKIRELEESSGARIKVS